MQFRTPYNYQAVETDFEPANPISETVPDQSMSISELLARYQNGLVPTGSKRTYFESDAIDVTFDDIDPTLDTNFDLTDTNERFKNLENTYSDNGNSGQRNSEPTPSENNKREEKVSKEKKEESTENSTIVE